jgi:hypothetical protein
MPGVCRCCRHPRLAALHQALDQGLSYRKVAKSFPPLSADSIRRHALHCRKRVAVAEQQFHAPADLEQDSHARLLALVTSHRKACESLLASAYTRADIRAAISASRALAVWDELEARLAHVLDRPASPTSVTMNTVVVGGEDPRERLLRKLGLGEPLSLPEPMEGGKVQ